jgi:hypothetical protein
MEEAQHTLSLSRSRRRIFNPRQQATVEQLQFIDFKREEREISL